MGHHNRVPGTGVCTEHYRNLVPRNGEAAKPPRIQPVSLWTAGRYCAPSKTANRHRRSDLGLALSQAYAELSKEGMRGAGHFIELPDAFLPWVQKKPRLTLSDFVVLKDFGGKGCGCCDE